MRSRVQLPGWAVLVVSAVAFWVVAFLPWIVEGMRLPLSSAWPRIYTNEGPVVALPFGEHAIPVLLVSCVAGGTAALAVSRLAAPAVARPRLLAGAGAALALLVALAQTLFTVRPALAETDEARLLVAALVVATIASGAFGIAVGAGVVRGRGWPWLLGGAVVASLFGPWLIDLVDARPQGVASWLAQLLQWHPWVGGVLLGVVLAIFGYQPTSRLFGWLVALAIAWVIPSVLTAVTYVVHYAGQGTLTRSHVAEVLDAGRDVFVQSLQLGGRSISPLVLAVVIGAAGAAWRVKESSDRRA